MKAYVTNYTTKFFVIFQVCPFNDEKYTLDPFNRL